MSGISDQCQRLRDAIGVLNEAIAQIPAIGAQTSRFDAIRQHLDGMRTANGSLQEKATPFDDGTTSIPDEIRRGILMVPANCTDVVKELQAGLLVNLAASQRALETGTRALGLAARGLDIASSLAQAETTGDSPPYASTSINNDILALKARLADDRDNDTNGVQVAVISEFLDSLQRYASAHSGNVVGPSMANQGSDPQASGSGNPASPRSSALFDDATGPGLPIPAYTAVDVPRAPHRIHLRHVSRLSDLEYEPLDIVFDPYSKVPRVAVADFYSRIRFFNVRNPKTPAGSQGVATLAYTSHTNGLHLRLAPAGPARLAVLTELPSSNDLAEQGHDGVHFNKSTINVHDYGTNTGGRVAQIRQGSVRPFDFSADGKLLAVRGSRGRIEVVMTNGGKGVAVVRGHTDEVVDARFTSDGTGLVSISKDGTLRVTSTTTWQGTAKLEMPEWRNPVFLAVPATASNIVMTAWGRRVYLWNPETGALDKWRLDGDGDEAGTEGWPLAASPDLRFLCCRTDQGADVREVASGRVLCRLGFGAGFATAAAWSADSKMLALGRIVGGNFGQGQGRIDFWEVIE